MSTSRKPTDFCRSPIGVVGRPPLQISASIPGPLPRLLAFVASDLTAASSGRFVVLTFLSLAVLRIRSATTLVPESIGPTLTVRPDRSFRWTASDAVGTTTCT
jgi:hypothetical protein